MRRARLTVPFSVAGAEALPDGRGAPGRRVAAGRSVGARRACRAERERLAVAYVPDPKAKGLDVLVAGWAAAAVTEPGSRSTGSTPSWARSHLRRTGVPEPDDARAARHGAGRGVPRAPAPGARLRGRRALGGLGPGAARGAGGRRAARDRPVRRPVRGAAAGAPARRRRSWRARSTAPRSARRSARPSRCRTSACAPTASGRPSCCGPYRSDAVQETVTRELLPALLGRPGTKGTVQPRECVSV